MKTAAKINAWNDRKHHHHHRRPCGTRGKVCVDQILWCGRVRAAAACSPLPAVTPAAGFLGGLLISVQSSDLDRLHSNTGGFTPLTHYRAAEHLTARSVHAFKHTLHTPRPALSPQPDPSHCVHLLCLHDTAEYNNYALRY